MDILLLGGALAFAGAYVKQRDSSMQRRVESRLKKSRAHDESLHDLLFEESGPHRDETIYANERYDHNLGQFVKLVHKHEKRLDRDKQLYDPSQHIQRHVFENTGHRAVHERFSADLPESDTFAGKNRRKMEQTNFASNMLPQIPLDDAAILTEFQKYQSGNLSGRQDGVKLQALAAPDMPLSEVVTRIFPKTPEELFVKTKSDARPVNREPLRDVRYEMPPVLAELPPSRNPLAGIRNTHTGFFGNDAMQQALPNRDTTWVNKDLNSSQKSGKREGFALEPQSAGEGRKKYDDRSYSWAPMASMPDRGALSRQDTEAPRLPNRKETYDPARYTQLDMKEGPSQEKVAPLPPTRKEHFLHIANHAQTDMDKMVLNLWRPGDIKATGRELLLHEPRLGPPTTAIMNVGPGPLLRDTDVPKTAGRELTMFSMDPDSGLAGAPTSSLWGVNDGRGTKMLPPKTGLKELLVHEPRFGPRDRPDLNPSQPLPQVAKKPKRTLAVYNTREPIRRTAESEVYGNSVGQINHIRQNVQFDQMNRSQFQGLTTGPGGPDVDTFVISGRDFKTRKQSVLNSGLSWPGEDKVKQVRY